MAASPLGFWRRAVALDRFALSGDIDRGTVPTLRDELCAFVSRTREDVALDCSDLSSIDGDGVRALIALRDRLAHDGRCLKFVAMSDSVSHDLLGTSSSDELVADGRGAMR
jgi:anti-anti-sigma factor